MGILSRAFTYLDRWVDRVVCVAGATLFAQAPEFMQQYLQRLGGHLDEARRALSGLLATASRSGQDPLVWAAQAQQSVDPVTADLGRLLLTSHTRVEQLAHAQTALREATAWDRPWRFLAQVDVQILRGTWQDYAPAVPTTGEGALYALAGMTVAWLGYTALLSVWRRRQKSR